MNGCGFEWDIRSLLRMGEERWFRPGAWPRGGGDILRRGRLVRAVARRGHVKYAGAAIDKSVDHLGRGRVQPLG